MKKLKVYIKNNKIFLQDEEVVEVIMDVERYKYMLNNSHSGEFKIFDKIINEFQIKDANSIVEQFSYIFNFILVNNISNYIIDKYKYNDYRELVFDESIKNNKKEIIKLSGLLDINDAIGDIILSLINFDEYLNGTIKIDYGKLQPESKETNIEQKDLEYFIEYRTKEIESLVDKLKVDLVAFKFIDNNNINESGRYILPVYVDEKALISKNISNYNDYIINWESIAYLKMISQIHDFFIDYYKLDYKKGLETDNLTLALIDLLDSEIKPCPVGLEKSIEVGRATKGKCYFIDGIVPPISLPQELAIILQAKDVFSVVPRIFKSNR